MNVSLGNLSHCLRTIINLCVVVVTAVATEVTAATRIVCPCGLTEWLRTHDTLGPLCHDCANGFGYVVCERCRNVVDPTLTERVEADYDGERYTYCLSHRVDPFVRWSNAREVAYTVGGVL